MNTQVTAPDYFSAYRITSVTRPNMPAGLRTGFGQFTRQVLEQADAEDFGFYADDFFKSMRGDQLTTEEFMLQGGDGRDTWFDIKPIVPIPGDDPRDLLDEEDDDRWGQCMRCERNLTESEAALNDTCEGCRPIVYAEHAAKQERLAEEAEERRRYPEESDDDYDERY